eukprot:1187105-Prorocentrum_minimum.AAC.7
MLRKPTHDRKITIRYRNDKQKHRNTSVVQHFHQQATLLYLQWTLFLVGSVWTLCRGLASRFTSLNVARLVEPPSCCGVVWVLTTNLGYLQPHQPLSTRRSPCLTDPGPCPLHRGGPARVPPVLAHTLGRGAQAALRLARQIRVLVAARAGAAAAAIPGTLAHAPGPFPRRGAMSRTSSAWPLARTSEGETGTTTAPRLSKSVTQTRLSSWEKVRVVLLSMRVLTGVHNIFSFLGSFSFATYMYLRNMA